MLAKDKMFKIKSVVMESGCTKYLLYRYCGLLHIMLNGSRYALYGKYDNMVEAMTTMNRTYEYEANSCMKSKEKEVWPNKEK